MVGITMSLDGSLVIRIIACGVFYTDLGGCAASPTGCSDPKRPVPSHEDVRDPSPLSQQPIGPDMARPRGALLHTGSEREEGRTC
jgi:hypothetical protein